MINPENYDSMRDWFALVSHKALGKYVTPESNPLKALDQLAIKSPSKARDGLSMAIGDLIEMTDAWPAEQVADLDQKLTGQRLPTLSAVRARFSKAVRSVVRRGQIRDDAEYYAVRNAAELTSDADELWQLLSKYEARAASGS